MHQVRALLLGTAAFLAPLTLPVSAQDLTAREITYQGILSQAGQPAEGLFEMKFQYRLPGPPPILIDPPIILPNVPVISGRFSVLLPTEGIPLNDPAGLELVICIKDPISQQFIPLDPPLTRQANKPPGVDIPASAGLTHQPMSRRWRRRLGADRWHPRARRTIGVRSAPLGRRQHPRPAASFPV